MPFADYPLDAHPLNKNVTGLGVTQSAPMTLEVAAGNVQEYDTGETYPLAAPEPLVFTADPVLPTQVFMAFIASDTDCYVWADTYLDDGLNGRSPFPAGYRMVIDLAWFTIAPNETDLLNGTVSRRIWL